VTSKSKKPQKGSPSGRKRQKVLTGQEVIDFASEYPPMIVSFCYDSAEILAGVYHELRTAEGTRSSIIPGIDEPRLIEHGWCVRRDGRIVDSVFTEELSGEPEWNPAAIVVTYTEGTLSANARGGQPGALRKEIWRRARDERPPLLSAQQRWVFAEMQRDEFRRWLISIGRLAE